MERNNGRSGIKFTTPNWRFRSCSCQELDCRTRQSDEIVHTCIAVSNEPAATWSPAKGEFRIHSSFSLTPGVASAPSSWSSSPAVSSGKGPGCSSPSTSNSQPPASGSMSSWPSSSFAHASSADAEVVAAASTPLMYGASTPASRCPFARARSKKLSPPEISGQLSSVIVVTTGGGLRVDAPNDGTSSISASVKPAASKTSRASSSSPLVFAVRYASESLAERYKRIEHNSHRDLRRVTSLRTATRFLTSLAYNALWNLDNGSPLASAIFCIFNNLSVLPVAR